MKLYDYQTIIEMLPRLLVLSFQYSALYFTMSFFSTPLWPSLIASAVFFFVMSMKLVTDAWACHWNYCRLSLAIFQTDFPWVKAITSGMSSCALVAWFNIESVTMMSAIVFCVCMGVYKQTSPCLLLQKPSPEVSLHRQYSELLEGKFSVRLVFGTVILWIASKIIGGTFSAWALCTLVIMLVDLPTAWFIAKFKAKCQFKLESADLQELITANEPEAQLIGLNTLQNDLLKRKVNKLEFEKFQSLIDRFSSLATEGLIRHHFQLHRLASRQKDLMKVANVSFAELISGMDIIGAYKKAKTQLTGHFKMQTDLEQARMSLQLIEAFCESVISVHRFKVASSSGDQNFRHYLREQLNVFHEQLGAITETMTSLQSNENSFVRKALYPWMKALRRLSSEIRTLRTRF